MIRLSDLRRSEYDHILRCHLALQCHLALRPVTVAKEYKRLATRPVATEISAATKGQPPFNRFPAYAAPIGRFISLSTIDKSRSENSSIM